MNSEQIEGLQGVVNSSEAVEHDHIKDNTVCSSDAIVVEEHQSSGNNIDGDDPITDPLIATTETDLQCCGCIFLCLEYLFCIKVFRNISLGTCKVCECIVDCWEFATWCVDCNCENCSCDCGDSRDCNCDCEDCIDTCCNTI